MPPSGTVPYKAMYLLADALHVDPKRGSHEWASPLLPAACDTPISG